VRILYAILAKKAIIESSANTSSLIEIIEEITYGRLAEPITGHLATPAECVLATLWERDSDEPGGRRDVKVWVETPLGKWIEADVFVDFEDKLRTRGNFTFNALPIAGPGRYTYNVESGGVRAVWPVFFVESAADLKPNAIQVVQQQPN
jgi:hypothetical protein